MQRRKEEQTKKCVNERSTYKIIPRRKDSRRKIARWKNVRQRNVRQKSVGRKNARRKIVLIPCSYTTGHPAGVLSWEWWNILALLIHCSCVPEKGRAIQRTKLIKLKCGRRTIDCYGATKLMSSRGLDPKSEVVSRIHAHCISFPCN